MLTKCEAFSGVIVGSRDRPYTLVAASCARAGSSSAAVHAPASAAATARPQQTLAAPPITQWTRPRRIFKKMEETVIIRICLKVFFAGNEKRWFDHCTWSVGHPFLSAFIFL